jgi:hypothetical protein
MDLDMFPKSPPPADRIHVLDLSRVFQVFDQNQEIIAFMSLAGLVNRSEPAIYLAASREDPWPDWMKERGDIEDYEWVADPYDLFTWYGDRTNGLVVVDTSVSATYNVACVVAACEGLIACHPNHVSRIQNHNPSLLVVRDLKDEHFAHNGEAYAWAYERYWSEMRHDILAWIDTSLRPTGPRDYCVAHKVFPLWVNGYGFPWEAGINVAQERAFAEKVLDETPENIPILGWPGTSRGLGEHGGIKLWSEHGKFAVVVGDLTGLSFHSGCAPVSMGGYPRTAPPVFDIDKVYYSTYHSEGEVLWHEDPFRDAWKSPFRGETPYGWSIGLLQREIIPAPLDWYLHGDGSTQGIQPEDELVSAMSGLGYIFPQYYPKKARKGFLQMTKAALDANEMTSLAIHFKGAPYPEKKALTREYGEQLESSAHSILADYMYKPGTHYRQTNYLSHGVPTFHALAPHFRKERTSSEETAEQFHERLQNRGAPAFGQVFLFGWSSGPRRGKELKDAFDGLEADVYVPVRPDELGILYRESGAGVELDFFDDFSGGDGHWTVESGQWEAGGGSYVQENTGPAWRVSRAGNCQWDNIAVSAVLRGSDLAGNAGMALFGRFRGMNNAYYRFELWQDSRGRFARLFKKTQGGDPALLAEERYESGLAQDTLLEMVVHCDTIVCRVDGSEVIDVVDADPIPRGWIALGSYGSRTVVDEVLAVPSRACVDCDRDGYGAPGDASCHNGEEWDCDDYDAAESPMGVEGPTGRPSCADGLDNDCDGLFDGDDADCQ